jgi:transporter family-2 protein
MDRALAVLVTLMVGGLVAAQPPVNAALARHVSDLGAAFVSLSISTAIVAVLLVTVGDAGALRGMSAFKPEYLLGGIAGAGIVAVTLVTVRSLGASGVTAALICAQLAVSVVLDRLGVLGLEETPLTVARIAGIGLLFAGTILVVSR